MLCRAEYDRPETRIGERINDMVKAIFDQIELNNPPGESRCTLFGRIISHSGCQPLAALAGIPGEKSA